MTDKNGRLLDKLKNRIIVIDELYIDKISNFREYTEQEVVKMYKLIRRKERNGDE